MIEPNITRRAPNLDNMDVGESAPIASVYVLAPPSSNKGKLY